MLFIMRWLGWLTAYFLIIKELSSKTEAKWIPMTREDFHHAASRLLERNFGRGQPLDSFRVSRMKLQVECIGFCKFRGRLFFPSQALVGLGELVVNLAVFIPMDSELELRYRLPIIAHLDLGNSKEFVDIRILRLECGRLLQPDYCLFRLMLAEVDSTHQDQRSAMAGIQSQLGLKFIARLVCLVALPKQAPEFIMEIRQARTLGKSEPVLLNGLEILIARGV